MNSMALKAKINNVAIKNNASPQAVLTMYMFERILMRIEVSRYNENIILKGGLLLSSLIGIDMRTTKDMDANLKGIPLQKNILKNIFNEVLNIDLNDNIKFNINDIEDIRKRDKYNAFVIEIIAVYQNMNISLSIDISSGDIITPREMKYKYKKLFDEGYINILSYTIETVIAEKFETIIVRGINNTRAKDFYDLYMLMKTYEKLSDQVLKKAITNTFIARETEEYLEDLIEKYNEIKGNENLKNIWKIYAKSNSFVSDISFDQVVLSVKDIINILY